MDHKSSQADECCAFMQYTELGTRITTVKTCLSLDDLKEYYANYQLKVGASQVGATCTDGKWKMGSVIIDSAGILNVQRAMTMCAIFFFLIFI